MNATVIVEEIYFDVTRNVPPLVRQQKVCSDHVRICLGDNLLNKRANLEIFIINDS